MLYIDASGSPPTGLGQGESCLACLWGATGKCLLIDFQITGDEDETELECGNFCPPSPFFHFLVCPRVTLICPCCGDSLIYRNIRAQDAENKICDLCQCNYKIAQIDEIYQERNEAPNQLIF